MAASLVPTLANLAQLALKASHSSAPLALPPSQFQIIFYRSDKLICVSGLQLLQRNIIV
ncbi:hypothetical protein SAMCFNEI73_pC0494 (plasmid) [Sinorhizobium americanum]|uniref:Uncharacterized protein n=1 Tax=Sinorhizobium americanum TaxID=194963 RepID=A0A1L3LVT7_9HYPH|nr:hypothetical protein SAMCFNEI73_pC0494 [Sinorhizobium americanum]